MDICTLIVTSLFYTTALNSCWHADTNCLADKTGPRLLCQGSPCVQTSRPQYICKRPDGTTYDYTAHD